MARAGSGCPRTSYRSRLSLLWFGSGHHGRGKRGAAPFWSLRPRSGARAIAVLSVGIAHRRLDLASSPRYTGLYATSSSGHVVLHRLPPLAMDTYLVITLPPLCAH